MDELLALQAELAKVQSAPSSFKLSEPNVVEVVQKLVELGLLEVLFTTNGKEYLTPKQLRNEVEDEIVARGGRVNITELAPVLNVDLPHIEKVVRELLSSQGSSMLGTLQLFQGDVISDVYLENLADEINQDLKARRPLRPLTAHAATTDAPPPFRVGCALASSTAPTPECAPQPRVSQSHHLVPGRRAADDRRPGRETHPHFRICDAAGRTEAWQLHPGDDGDIRYTGRLMLELGVAALYPCQDGRSINCTTDCCAPGQNERRQPLHTLHALHTLHTLQAKMSGGSLYTSTYVTRHNARVRGVLSALTKPAALSQLIKDYNFNEGLFHDCVTVGVTVCVTASSTIASPCAGTASIPHDLRVTAQRPTPTLQASLPLGSPDPLRDAIVHESHTRHCERYMMSQELVASGRLGGTLYGKSTFTPAVYAHAQSASVLAYFQQNGIIDYAALAKMQAR